MVAGLTGFKRWIFLGVVAFVALLVAAAIFYRQDILRTALDPKVPFQTYDPPPAPDYAQHGAWAMLPPTAGKAAGTDLPVDVFFIHPTTYNGGGEWNARLDKEEANRQLTEQMLPNYAGPFARVGRIFAPRYRQASLYTRMTLRDDAREARRFAYGDIRAAFQLYRARYNQGRPFIVVGVEQGGELAMRLLAEEVAPDEALRGRLAAAYLTDTVVPADAPPIQPCMRRRQAHCLVAYAQAVEGDAERERQLLNRSLIWDGHGQLVELGGRRPVCVNPLIGAASDEPAPARTHLGAANATGLEWGARPAFLSRQVAAQCRNGILRVTEPKSQSLQPAGGWADRLKAPGYNLFYADLEADAQARVATLLGRPDFPTPAPGMGPAIEVDEAPVNRIR